MWMWKIWLETKAKISHIIPHPNATIARAILIHCLHLDNLMIQLHRCHHHQLCPPASLKRLLWHQSDYLLVMPEPGNPNIIHSIPGIPCVRNYKYSAISGLSITSLLMMGCHFKRGRENGLELGVCGEHLLWSHTSQKIHHCGPLLVASPLWQHTPILRFHASLKLFILWRLHPIFFRNLEFVVQYENLTSLMPTMPMPMPHHQSQLIVCVTWWFNYTMCPSQILVPVILVLEASPPILCWISCGPCLHHIHQSLRSSFIPEAPPCGRHQLF